MSYNRNLSNLNCTMNQEARDTLKQFCESPENLEILQKLTANLNAIADKLPLPYPEMIEKYINEPDAKRLKLEPESSSETSTSVKKMDEEILSQEIKLAIEEEKKGNLQNSHLNNIKQILSEKPDLINKKATCFMVYPLNQCVTSGSVELTKELLKFNPNLFCINSFGETPLNQGMKVTRTHKSLNIFNTCVEILKAHQRNGTIDNSIFNHVIKQNEDCYQLLSNIIRVDIKDLS